MNNKVQTFLSVLLGLTCFSCAVDPDPLMDGQDQGSLRVAMQHQGADGAIYHLRDAKLHLTGAADTVIEVGDTTIVQHPLPEGDYLLELKEGWWMEKEKDGFLEAVQAELISPNPVPVVISAGEITNVTLKFQVVGAGQLSFETGELAVGMEVVAAVDSDGGMTDLSDSGTSDCEPMLVINELDYNQDGADEAEFIELYNPSTCDISTDALKLDLVNGGIEGEAAIYASVDLSAAGSPIEAGEYLVVGSDQVLQTLADTTRSVLLTKSVQNGDPDGILLSNGDVVLDSLSYGGFMAEVTETDSAPTDTGTGSIGRCENGQDSDDNAADFVFSETITPGAPNLCTPPTI